MQKVDTSLQQEFESSSKLTPQFANFYKLFKRKFTKMLKKNFDIVKIHLRLGHFYVSGFFHLTDGRIWHFYLVDSKWGDNNLTKISYKSKKKQKVFKKRRYPMQKVAIALQQEFESSSQLTPQFAEFYKLFKREFTKMLKKNFDIVKIRIRLGHFYISGFFQLTDGSIFHFHLGDVRWDCFGDGKKLLIKTANSFEDYVSGNYNFVDVDDIEKIKQIVLSS